jgi:DNA adenine methylase
MSNIVAKPFLKWAGGKTQLISEIKKVLPKEIYEKKFVYVEPFVGSGAVLFWMLNNFTNIKKAIINDVNKDLITTYKVIASNPNELIKILYTLEKEYHKLEGNEDAKKEYYYQKRSLYNQRNQSEVIQSALFIFLNRTCFNGLYRVNQKNEFNVPIGKYKKPTICDKENIIAVSKALQKVEIICGDFEKTIKYAGKNTLFYLDPPYKPISKTSSFTSYAAEDFDDEDQIRLKDFCIQLDKKGSYWILSNSDVREKNKKERYFDKLYSNFTVKRVKARRSINANPQKRGELSEVLITNQKPLNEYVEAI